MTEAYQSQPNGHERSAVLDSLEAYVREGARRMLAAALDEEVSAFLGRDRYERGKPFRGYRNGYHEARELTIGVGAVDVRVPRVAGVPAELAPEGYRSQIVQRYQRASPGTQELFARLYLEGLAIHSLRSGPISSRCSGSWSGRPRRCRPTRWCG
jgi:transposase-like protein